MKAKVGFIFNVSFGQPIFFLGIAYHDKSIHVGIGFFKFEIKLNIY